MVLGLVLYTGVLINRADLTTPVWVFVTVGPALWKNSILSTYFPSWNHHFKLVQNYTLKVTLASSLSMFL